MQALLDAVVELASLVSPSRIRTVTDALRGLATPDVAPAVETLVGTPPARASVGRLLAAWAQGGVSGDEVAGMLLGASEARQHAEREQSVELVWTGPTTRFVATRRTEQVLLDLVRHARSDLFLVSFVVYDVTSVVDELNAAVERGIDVRILLEASTSHGGSLSVDPIATMRNRVPSASLYAWADRPAPFVDGRVHAKVAVADGSLAFLTSANLTGHALEKNMEAGVVVSGGDLPGRLRSHLHALIETNVVRLV